MAGQAIVTIRDKQWQCAVANTPQELVTGLSGVESISPGTGMLFDMGWDYPVIDIYTDEMLFTMDIIFINSVYGVVEVLRNVRPGDEALFQGEPGAWYFLEINAGEAEGIEVGDGVLIQPGEEIPAAPSWITGLAGLAGFVTMGIFMVGIARSLTSKALEEPEEKPALLPRTTPKQSAGQYEIETDRMGNIIITRTDYPGKDIFLQFESDKALVHDLLKKGERKDLDAGWEVKVKRSEPRASILDELWESSAQPQNLPHSIHENGDVGLPLPFAGAGIDWLRWQTTVGGRTVTVEVTGVSGLSRKQLENAFTGSTARLSSLVVRRKLPFAAATKEKLWWLATIRDKTVQVEVSGIKGLSERQIEDAFVNSVAVIVATAITIKKPSRSDVTVEAWQERDRLGIWITDRRTSKTIAEWWDEDAREMFEQGFFKPGIPQRTTEKPSRAFVESVFDYAESVGLLAGGKYLAQTIKEAYYWTAVNKDSGEITESFTPYTRSGHALKGGKAFVSRYWQGLALVEVWKQPYHYSENLKIEPVASESLTLQKAPAAIATGDKPSGNCYANAWRFVIREGEGTLIHGTVYSGNRRIGHAWVETATDWIWEPQTGRYFTNLGFRHDYAPVEESRYTVEEAAIMAARTKHLGPWTEQERRRYLNEKSPAVISEHKRQPRLKGEIEFLPDSPEFLAYTIDDIGYRDKIDSAFLSAIARAKGGR
jgi:uncharacterized membrane protein (UPF0127 family)